ncbi:MAG: hypothetical protein BV458_03440 [Thermoplasmata archaeon M9B2D]|nr:MAG: hypothetical protein BV458_03440 [Thermoplasmata archaeon M9B2D]
MAKGITFRTKAMVEKTSKGWTVNAIATESKKVDWNTVEDTMVAKGWNISGVIEENEKGMTYGWFNVLDVCCTKAEAMEVYRDLMDTIITMEDLEKEKVESDSTPSEGTVEWIRLNKVQGCDTETCKGCPNMENCITREGTDATDYLTIEAKGRIDIKKFGDLKLKEGDRVRYTLEYDEENFGMEGTVTNAFRSEMTFYPYFITWDNGKNDCVSWSGRGYYNESKPRIDKIEEDGSDDPTPEENFRPMKEMTKDEIVAEYNDITGADVTSFHYSRVTFESLLKVARVDTNTSHKEKIGHYEFTFIEGDFFGSDYTIKVIEMFDTVAVAWYTRELYYKDRDHMVKDLSDRYNHI